jgi:hypothetical protein
MRKTKVLVKESMVSFVRRLPLEEKPCAVCGRLFTGIKKRKYCSRTCINKADYQKHAASRQQARREKYKATAR